MNTNTVNDTRQAIEVRLKVTHKPTFIIEGAESIKHAILLASNSFWDGDPPHDETLPVCEVNGIKVGDQEITFQYLMDWNGPTDADGQHRWKVIAYDDRHKQVAEGYHVTEVAQAAIEVVTP